ncbi:hypothetical protein MPER_08382, partial [Moniliophthora perniciosa FA553]
HYHHDHVHTNYRWVKFGLFLMTVAVNINGPMLWIFIPSNVAGRTKKSIVFSVLIVGYRTGNVVGAQMFRAKDAPRYVSAIIACAICFALNYAAAAEQGLTHEQVKEFGAIDAEKDMTDRQNPNFRYTY